MSYTSDADGTRIELVCAFSVFITEASRKVEVLESTKHTQLRSFANQSLREVCRQEKCRVRDKASPKQTQNLHNTLITYSNSNNDTAVSFGLVSSRHKEGFSSPYDPDRL